MNNREMSLKLVLILCLSITVSCSPSEKSNSGQPASSVSVISNSSTVPASQANTEPDWGGKDGAYYLVDKNGKRLTDETFANVASFSEGLAPIERQSDKGALWGYVDYSGKFAFDPIYDDAEEFNKSIAKVTLKGRTFYIDKTGKEVSQ